MILDHYLNQREPVKALDVFVGKNQYTVINQITLASGEKRSSVRINKSELSDIEYCLIGKRFYTTDTDGNPKNASCFRVS